MTLTQRIDKTYEQAMEMGLVIKVVEGEEGAAPKYRTFTKADARKLVEAEDKRNEEALLNKEPVSTSYGAIKPVPRKERAGRNPKTGEPIHIPAKTAVVVSVGKNFNGKLNPHLAGK